MSEKSEKPMTVGERRTLQEIRDWNGKYSIHWTQKTTEKLEARGYVSVSDQHVKITKAGFDALKSLNQ
jgi:hypothetical protein